MAWTPLPVRDILELIKADDSASTARRQHIITTAYAVAIHNGKCSTRAAAREVLRKYANLGLTAKTEGGISYHLNRRLMAVRLDSSLRSRTNIFLNTYREKITNRRGTPLLKDPRRDLRPHSREDLRLEDAKALLKRGLERKAQSGGGGDGDSVSTDEEWGDVTDQEKAAKKAKKKEERQNFKDWQNTRGARVCRMTRHITHEDARALQLAKWQKMQAKRAKEEAKKASTKRREEALRNEAVSKGPALLERIDKYGLDKAHLRLEDLRVIIRSKKGKVPSGNKAEPLDIVRALCKDKNER